MIDFFLEMTYTIFIENWESSIWFVLGIYVIGIMIDYNTSRYHNYEYHEGGFLNMGYSTHDIRDGTPKDVWWALIWPIKVVWYVVLSLLSISHDIITFLFLMFGFKYKETKLHKKIEDLLYW